jgi:hypothetical protein
MSYNDKRTVYDSKVTILVLATPGVVPLFVREGAIIPRGDMRPERVRISELAVGQTSAESGLPFRLT